MPGTTASRGPERVRRGASLAPLPRRGPVAGTMSPVLGRPPRAPRSHPVKPGAQAPGMGKGSTASGKPTKAPKATGLDEARRTTLGHQARQRGMLSAKTKAHGQVPSNNGHQVPRNEPRHWNRCQATPNPHTTNPSQDWRATSGAHTQAHTHPNTPARSGGAQPKPEPKHTNPHRTPKPVVAGYKRSAHTNTHKPQHASQEWWSAAKTRAQAHTATPHTPARSGGVQAEHAHKNQTPTPQPGVAGHSQNPSPSTHTHTAHPSKECRGTSGARTQAHTHPDTPARSSGAQLKPEPKHTHPHRTPQPGVAGYKRSADTNTHKPQHPSQEWRGAAETRG